MRATAILIALVSLLCLGGEAGCDGDQPVYGTHVILDPREEVCNAPVCGDGEATRCHQEREACDGQDLRERSCASLGFAGGTLGCAADCTLDISGCDACAGDPGVSQCRHFATAPGVSHGMGLAVREGVVLVATAISESSAYGEVFVDGGVRSDHVRAVRLLALDAELQPLREARELPIQEAWVIGLVAVSDGFLLAYADGWQEQAVLHAQHLDATGEPDADAVELDGSGDSGSLIAGPGGPLLVTTAPGGGGARAVVLDEHGVARASTQLAADYVREGTSGTFTRDGFVVPVARIAGGDTYTLHHVGLDGRTASGFVLPAASDEGGIYSVQTSWDGASAWTLWSDTGADELACGDPPPPEVLDAAVVVCDRHASALRWARLDANGALLDGPHDLGGVERAAAALLHDGSALVVVSGAHEIATGPSGLVLHRLDGEMNAGDAVQIAPDAEVDAFRAVATDDRSVVVAFTQHALYETEYDVGWLTLAAVPAPR
jgi:hypothetical protein